MTDQDQYIKYMNTVLTTLKLISKLNKMDESGTVSIKLDSMNDPIILNFNPENKYIYNHLITLMTDFKQSVNLSFELPILEKIEKEEAEKKQIEPEQKIEKIIKNKKKNKSI